VVYVRLLHSLKELPRVRRERLYIASLPFGVDGIESEGRLARAGWTCDDRECASRYLYVEPFEIMLARSADDDLGLHPLKIAPPSPNKNRQLLSASVAKDEPPREENEDGAEGGEQD
jgi:hypothetical protein